MSDLANDVDRSHLQDDGVLEIDAAPVYQEVFGGGSLPKWFTIQTNGHTPVANPDSFTTIEDTSLVVAAPGVLANDTDVDGDALSIQSVQGATHGTVSIVNGNVVFTPEANWAAASR